MVNAILLDEEAGRLGIRADKKRVDDGVSSFLGNVGVTSEEEFEKKANLHSGFLRALISRDVRRNMLLEKLHPDIVNITEDEESEVRSRFEAFNERADATNAIQRANCTKIISEINAGLDFAAAYGKYNQVEPLAGNGCDWGDFFKLELKANEKLADWVFKAPVGSVGGPFEWEDGYCIIKITDRTDGTEEEYSVSASVASVHLQKITLLYSERLPVPDGKALRKQMSDARRRESLEELVRQLHSTMTLDYPNGTVIDGAD